MKTFASIAAQATEQLIEQIHFDESESSSIATITLFHDSADSVWWVVSAKMESNYNYKYAMYFNSENGTILADGY